MKSVKLITLIYIICICLVFNNSTIFCQGCPQGSENWQTSSYYCDILYYNASATVNYSYNNTGSGGTNFKIDWSSLNVQNASTTKTSAWKKMIEQNLVESLVVANCPHIDGYQWIVNIYYERKCSTTTKFVYDLDVTTQVICCSNPAISQSIYDTFKDGVLHKVYNIYKDVECGTKCCRRQYTCTIHHDNVYDFWGASIDQILTYSETNCSGNSSNIDCVTGNPTPCNDGSCND